MVDLIQAINQFRLGNRLRYEQVLITETLQVNKFLKELFPFLDNSDYENINFFNMSNEHKDMIGKISANFKKGRFNAAKSYPKLSDYKRLLDYKLTNSVQTINADDIKLAQQELLKYTLSGRWDRYKRFPLGLIFYENNSVDKNSVEFIFLPNKAVSGRDFTEYKRAYCPLSDITLSESDIVTKTETKRFGATLEETVTKYFHSGIFEFEKTRKLCHVYISNSDYMRTVTIQPRKYGRLVLEKP